MGVPLVRAIWIIPLTQKGEALRITLNKRLATAAAAIVHKMINRRRPLVLRPVSPFKKGSKTSTAMSDVADRFLGWHQGVPKRSKNRSCSAAQILRLLRGRPPNTQTLSRTQFSPYDSTSTFPPLYFIRISGLILLRDPDDL